MSQNELYIQNTSNLATYCLQSRFIKLTGSRFLGIYNEKSDIDFYAVAGSANALIQNINFDKVEMKIQSPLYKYSNVFCTLIFSNKKRNKSKCVVKVHLLRNFHAYEVYEKIHEYMKDIRKAPNIPLLRLAYHFLIASERHERSTYWMLAYQEVETYLELQNG